MTEPTAAPAAPPSLESVLRHAWDAFHPGQPAPLGWLTHTTTQIQAYLRNHHSDPQPPPAIPESLTQFRRQMWQALREAVSEHDIDIDAANRIMEVVDLPLLPRRWQVRLTLTVLAELTAGTSDDAFDAAEAAIETALAGAEIEARIEWNGNERDNADPGDLDPTDPWPGCPRNQRIPATRGSGLL